MPYTSMSSFPMSKDTAQAYQSALFILGLASFQISSWVFFSSGDGGDDANIAFTSYIFQFVGLIAIAIIDRKLKYSAFSIATAFNIASFIMVIGIVFFFFGGADILRHCGPGVYGAGSAFVFVGWGFYSCTMNPALSSLNLIRASAITGIVIFLLWDTPPEILVVFAIISPTLSCACFSALISGPLQKKLGADRTVRASTFSTLPKAPVVLLLFCMVLCTATKTVVPTELTLSAAEPCRIIWPAATVGFLAFYTPWKQTVEEKGNAMGSSRALSLMIIICLIGYSAFSYSELVWTTAFLNVSVDCLFLFCWIPIVQLVFRYNLPKVASFTFFSLIFACLQMLISFLAQIAIPEIPVIQESALSALSTLIHASCLITIIAVAAIACFFIEAHPHKEIERTLPANRHEPFKERITELADTYSLTGREVDVATCLVQGCTLRQTGERLFISLDTVRTHSKNLYTKLNIHKKQELIELVKPVQR